MLDWLNACAPFLLAISPVVCISLARDAAAADEPAMQQSRTRPATFLKCVACHSTAPGRNGTGPSLAGLDGRKAGSLPDFAYSEALKNSGITWNAESLDKWLAAPHEAVPGMCMPFKGFSDPVKRREVADYLLSLK